MNNKNTGVLAGYLVKVVKINPPIGKTLAARAELNIERPNSKNMDRVTLDVYDTNAAELLDTVIGSYILAPDSRVVSTNIEKQIPVVCSNCGIGNILKDSAEETTVVSNGAVIVMERPRTKSAMGVNTFNLLGNVCSPTDRMYEGQNDYKSLQIKVASDRPSFYIDRETGQKADYIFINSYGKVAEYLSNNFKIGDLIDVTGYLTQRVVEKSLTYDCVQCNSKTEVKTSNTVREIVASFAINFPNKYEVKSQDDLNNDREEYDKISQEVLYSDDLNNDVFQSDDEESAEVDYSDYI